MFQGKVKMIQHREARGVRIAVAAFAALAFAAITTTSGAEQAATQPATAQPSIIAQPSPVIGGDDGNTGGNGGFPVIGNFAGGTFADFRKHAQFRLLSSLDDTLSQKAEDAIIQNFNAVRKVNIDFQSSTGGRKGNAGINLVGAFAANDTRAFGWQLRGYLAQDAAAGVNAGAFYRKISDNHIIGGNIFADYEKHNDYGDFARYSIGGRVANNIASFAANYYIPITDTRKINSTVAAFSRRGYDGKARLSAPQLKRLKAALDYYHFQGEDGAANDNGFRYGMEWQPTPALRINAFYDDGGENFGGDIVYAWTIGGKPQQNNNAGNIAHDLFAPVAREYSQRIATVATTPSIPPAISQRNTSFAFGVHVPVATILLEGGAIAGNLPAGFAITANTIILFSASAVGQSSHALTITSAAHTMTASLALTHVPPVLSAVVATTRTTTRMTMAAFTTTMTVTTDVVDTRERVARVLGTFYIPNLDPTNPQVRGGSFASDIVFALLSNPVQVTLPPADTPRPWVVTVGAIETGINTEARRLQVLRGPVSPGDTTYLSGLRLDNNSPFTVTEGSERLVGPTTMEVVTMPETITPEMTTTTTLTTFATTTITTNIAAHTPPIPPMLEMPPMLSPMPKMAIMPPMLSPMPKMAIMPPMLSPIPQMPITPKMAIIPRMPVMPKMAMADIPIIRHSIIPSSPIPSFPRRRESRNHPAQSAA